ncbi:hypothetical protein ACNPNP_19640 [Microbacterium sp. AGC85]
MSGRDIDAHRIRSAHYASLDPETADRVMQREYRSAVRRDRGVRERRPEVDPAAVIALTSALARVAVVPGALLVPCAEHRAEAGRYCGRGIRYVCADRVRRAA